MMRMSLLGAAAGWPLLLVATAMGPQQGATVRWIAPPNVAPHPAPAQPLPFSHKTHTAAGVECETCHVNPAPGIQMSFPSPPICMTCHASVAADQPSILKLSEFAGSGDPIPWTRVYRLLPGVTWSHRKHLDGGMECAMCHGDVGQLDAMAEITGVTAMSSCIGCHAAQQAKNTCDTCHPWPSTRPR